MKPGRGGQTALRWRAAAIHQHWEKTLETSWPEVLLCSPSMGGSTGHPNMAETGSLGEHVLQLLPLVSLWLRNWILSRLLDYAYAQISRSSTSHVLCYLYTSSTKLYVHWISVFWRWWLPWCLTRTGIVLKTIPLHPSDTVGANFIVIFWIFSFLFFKVGLQHSISTFIF